MGTGSAVPIPPWPERFCREFVNNPDRSKESKAGDLIFSIMAVLIGGIEFKGG